MMPPPPPSLRQAARGRLARASAAAASASSSVAALDAVQDAERSSASLVAAVRALRKLQQRPDKVALAGDVLVLAIDAAFGVSSSASSSSSSSGRCWMDLGAAQRKPLAKLLAADGGVLFALVTELQHSAKVAIPLAHLPPRALAALAATRELPNAAFYNDRAVGYDAVEVTLFEYFFIGVAAFFARGGVCGGGGKAAKPGKHDDHNAQFALALLQQYLEHFMPLRSEEMWPEQQAFFNFQCERAKEMLAIFAEWWMQPRDAANARDPEFAVPPPLALEAIRRVLVHILSIADQQRCHEFAHEIRAALFRLLHAALARWPLEKLPMMSPMLSLWTTWLQPWRVDEARVKLGLVSAMPEGGGHQRIDAAAWFHFLHDNFAFYTALVASFFSSTLHLDLADAPQLAMLTSVLDVLSNADVLDMMRDAERKMGVRFAHQRAPGSLGWRRFAELCSQDPSVFLPLSSRSSHTHQLALRVRSALRLAQPRAAQPLRALLQRAAASLDLVFELNTDEIAAADQRDAMLLQRCTHVKATAAKTVLKPRLNASERASLRAGHAVCSRLDVPVIGDVWTLPPTRFESVWLLALLNSLPPPFNVRVLANRAVFALLCATVYIVYQIVRLVLAL